MQRCFITYKYLLIATKMFKHLMERLILENEFRKKILNKKNIFTTVYIRKIESKRDNYI